MRNLISKKNTIIYPWISNYFFSSKCYYFCIITIILQILTQIRENEKCVEVTRISKKYYKIIVISDGYLVTILVEIFVINM